MKERINDLKEFIPLWILVLPLIVVGLLILIFCFMYEPVRETTLKIFFRKKWKKLLKDREWREKVEYLEYKSEHKSVYTFIAPGIASYKFSLN